MYRANYDFLIYITCTSRATSKDETRLLLFSAGGGVRDAEGPRGDERLYREAADGSDRGTPTRGIAKRGDGQIEKVRSRGIREQARREDRQRGGGYGSAGLEGVQTALRLPAASRRQREEAEAREEIGARGSSAREPRIVLRSSTSALLLTSFSENV